MIGAGHDGASARTRPESADALGAFANVTERLAAPGTVDERLAAIAEAAAAATHADTVVVRLLDTVVGALVARAVISSSPALAAELEGSSVPADEGAEETDAATVPVPLRGARAPTGVDVVVRVPVTAGDRLVGTVELLRARRPFDEAERLLARVAASQVAVVVGAGANGGAPPAAIDGVFESLGDALAAAADGNRVGQVVTRLAARAAGAIGAVLWEPLDDDAQSLGVVATVGAVQAVPRTGLEPPVPNPGDRRTVVTVERDEPLPGGAAAAVIVRLGDSPAAFLELFFAAPPDPALLDALGAFAARAGQALRTSRRAARTAAELERTRALLAVVGQAIAELSLSHTLETAVARVAELLNAERVAIYLREEGSLRPAAERGLGPGHAAVADALLELALGPFRARGVLSVGDLASDPRLAGVQAAAESAGATAAAAIPLVVGEEIIGLLVAYLEHGRTPTEEETALLTALAAQLAVAVQNARLHEEAKRLGAERARALESEQQAARQLRAFYEVSQSFTRSLELEETLEAVARTAVELLEAEAAVIRTLERRRGTLSAHAIHVAEERLAPVVEAMLSRPQSLAGDTARRLVEGQGPLLLTPALAASLGEAYELLVPFLERGGSAAVVPIATGGELMATLTVVSLDAERPIGQAALGAAASLAAHAALAVDNARLYQQQRHFLDTMQRSLLPSSLPSARGLEVGHVYESSARLEVGGDVYDFMELADGRLAIVLGDVAGHGVDAAADMAMAKFVFRSLAREHPEPADFLAAANEVVVGEIALGKFITMIYLTVDGERGELRGAAAGHPPPRIVRGDAVHELAVRGLALGVERSQRYDEVRTGLATGEAVVLYTDGVLEARRDGELYGTARLDAVLRANAQAGAAEIAAAVLADCRAFAGGELGDDCAVVVARRV